ncbi:hypothetical protein L1987_61041 [Smallanthus sonchifolius]|uniref:Uncharacterized protein n=1 Tax=Smallanthus sonchifolius TaxID=185202 RepID=A0ACB9D9P5_9ASTR|nr:hypothetical protein L1987_61041 [Smallanthus sonchifolius]
MKDPVTLSTGITYDRDSIENWLFSRKNDVCPVTKQVVVDIELTPNHTLRRLIQSWCTLNAASGIESKANSSMTSSSQEVTGADEALCVLYHLKLSPTGLKSLFGKTGDFVETLTHVMQRADGYESRAYAVMLLKSMFEVAEPMQVTSLNPKFFMELVRILIDQISQKATKVTLKLLVSVCPWGRNRIKAVEVGMVPVLINALLESSEKRVSEMILMVLFLVCQSADGRAELVKHGGGLVVVSNAIFGVSPVAGERAVRILYSVAMFSGNTRVLQEMLELGVVEKLLLVLQVDCGSKMKEKAREILKIHSRVWNKSLCINYELI